MRNFTLPGIRAGIRIAIPGAFALLLSAMTPAAEPGRTASVHADGVEVHILADDHAASAPDVSRKPDSRASTCGPDYRRKALVTRLPVLSPVQISDLPRFAEELQAEIVRRMEAGGHFLPQASSNEAAYPLQSNRIEAQLNPEWIRDLARRYGVQFVVGGVLRDAGFEGERYVLSHGNDIRPGERKQELKLPLLSFFKPGLKATPAARRFEMDLLVFDGVSGAPIGRHRLAGKAEGEVLFGAEVVFDPSVGTGTQRFFASDFGKLVDARLNEAVDSIYRDIQCIPVPGSPRA